MRLEEKFVCSRQSMEMCPGVIKRYQVDQGNDQWTVSKLREMSIYPVILQR